MSDYQELIEYIKQWQSIDGVKPLNDAVFYTNFLRLIVNYPDDREIEFDGDGSYFGKQVTIHPFSFWDGGIRELNFEISYCNDKISVYSANHNGYWYPEFLCMDNKMPGFISLRSALFTLLKRVFGV